MGIDKADLDGDGRFDVMISDCITRNPPLQISQPTGGWRNENISWGFTMQNIVSWGVNLQDFDADGDVDLFLANSSDGYNQYILENTGAHQFVRRPVTLSRPTTFGVATATADYDGDGDLDVVLRFIDGQIVLLRNDSPRGSWLEVVPVPTRSNASALGVRVVATAAGRAQMREVSGGVSMLSQEEALVHFGFGAAQVVTDLAVRWPSGAVNVLANVPVNQRLRVVEPMATPDAAAGVDGQVDAGAGGDASTDSAAADAGPAEAGAQDASAQDAAAVDAGAQDAGAQDAAADAGGQAGSDGGCAMAQGRSRRPGGPLPILLLGALVVCARSVRRRWRA
jgi:hypothetical protein